MVVLWSTPVPGAADSLLVNLRLRRHAGHAIVVTENDRMASLREDAVACRGRLSPALYGDLYGKDSWVHGFVRRRKHWLVARRIRRHDDIVHDFDGGNRHRYLYRAANRRRARIELEKRKGRAATCIMSRPGLLTSANAPAHRCHTYLAAADVESMALCMVCDAGAISGSLLRP